MDEVQKKNFKTILLESNYVLTLILVKNWSSQTQKTGKILVAITQPLNPLNLFFSGYWTLRGRSG